MSAVAVGDMDPAFRLMHAADTLSLLRMVFCATKLNHDIIKFMEYEFKMILRQPPWFAVSTVLQVTRVVWSHLRCHILNLQHSSSFTHFKLHFPPIAGLWRGVAGGDIFA